MGHLINPVSTRLGFSTFWISSWSLANLNTYSYFILLDSIVVELISYFFYYSTTVDFLSKFGFFFSHFRFMRRGLSNFSVKVFFIPSTRVLLSKTFVELENRERLRFGYFLGFKFLKVSKFIRRWLVRRTGQLQERRSLFRLRRPRYFSGEFILRLKERCLFSKKLFKKQKKKKRAVRWRKFYKKITLKFHILKLFRQSYKLRARWFTFKKNSVLCLSRLLCARLLSNRQNVSKLINFYLNKSLLIWKHSGTFKGRFVFSTRCKKQRKEGFNIFQKFLTNQKQIKKFTLAKLKLFKQRYLVFTTFSRLRRANLTLSFFNYLASLYSSFLSENLRFLPLFHGGVKKAFSVSITFGVINKFRLLNPQFLARFIAKRLSYGIPLRRVLKPIVADLSKSIANVSQMLVGFRIKCSGRFNRAQMASVTIQRGGSLSLSSVGSLVNMGFSTAFLRYGACGIKVWVSSREWAGFSSVILNRKFSVLKILNNVVVSFLKRGKRLLKPYLYVYLMSFFLLNFFHLEKRTVCEPEVSSGSLCNSTLASGVLDLVGKDQFLNSCDLSYFILFGFLKLFRGLRWRRKKYFFLSKGIVKKKLKVKKFRGWKTKHQNLRKVTQQKSVSLKGVKAKKKYVKYLFTSFSSIKKNK